MTTASPVSQASHDDSVESRARRLLHANHHFRHRSDGFVLKHEGDVLIVAGAVRSFYLKQLIQTTLSKLSGVRKIDNQVQVIAAHHAHGGPHHPQAGVRHHS